MMEEFIIGLFVVAFCIFIAFYFYTEKVFVVRTIKNNKVNIEIFANVDNAILKMNSILREQGYNYKNKSLWVHCEKDNFDIQILEKNIY